MICSLDGCEKPMKKKGVCNMHYLRMWKTGSYELVRLVLAPQTISKSCSQCSIKLLRYMFAKNKSRPDGHIGVCDNCVNKKRLERYHANPDKYRAKKREYSNAHKDTIKENGKRFRVAHKDAIKAKKAEEYQKAKLCPQWQEKQRIMREANKEKKRLYDESYRERTKDKQKQWSDAWAANNKEKTRAIKHNYKVKRRAKEAAGVPSNLLAEWSIAQKKECYWCGIKCPGDYHIDHYEPLARGGKHELDNLVISCAPCNMRKKAKDPYEFAQKVAGRLF